MIQFGIKCTDRFIFNIKGFAMQKIYNIINNVQTTSFRIWFKHILLLVVLSCSGCAVDKARYSDNEDYKAGYRAGLQDAGVMYLGMAVGESLKNKCQ
jgi:hypothetical protein